MPKQQQKKLTMKTKTYLYRVFVGYRYFPLRTPFFFNMQLITK